MVTHVELLRDMVTVRRAFVARFKYFIHVTPADNFDAIRAHGLKPCFDSQPPPEVLQELGDDARNILCLHPLGAKLRPTGTKEPPLISLAVAAEHIPGRLGLDWSYSWVIVLGRMRQHPTMPIGEFVARIADEFGSIISYDPIPPDSLRAFCLRNESAHPLGWAPLTRVPKDQVVQHE
jgi:hypothetical protein